MSLDFVAIDWETANRYRSSPIQVGLAVVRGGAVRETWGSLMRPPRLFSRFDPDCIAVHGILPTEVAGQRSFLELWPEVERRVRRLPLVAHNASFDMGVIRDTFRVCGRPAPELDFACSLLLSRRHCRLDHFGLDAVAAHLGVTLSRHHDALADAVACAEVTLALARRTGAVSLGALLDSSSIEWGHLDATGLAPCREVETAAAPDFEEATLF